MRPGPDTARFLRHLAACNTARLPGRRLPLRLGDSRIGFVAPQIADALADFGVPRERQALVLPQHRAAELAGLAERLAACGLVRHRGEMFDVRAAPGGRALATVDRGALPALGVLSFGAHLNGLVRRPDGLHLWVGRRAADKALDPGKLDHLVAGGVPAGLSPWATLVKEADEEASLPAALLARARPAPTLAYAMDRPEGLRRDVLHCWDVELPESFTPLPRDGEVAAFELWPMARVMAAVRDTDDVKFNVNLVLLDLFRRLGLATGERAAT